MSARSVAFPALVLCASLLRRRCRGGVPSRPRWAVSLGAPLASLASGGPPSPPPRLGCRGCGLLSGLLASLAGGAVGLLLLVAGFPRFARVMVGGALVGTSRNMTKQNAVPAQSKILQIGRQRRRFRVGRASHYAPMRNNRPLRVKFCSQPIRTIKRKKAHLLNIRKLISKNLGNDFLILI